MLTRNLDDADMDLMYLLGDTVHCLRQARNHILCQMSIPVPDFVKTQSGKPDSAETTTQNIKFSDEMPGTQDIMPSYVDPLRSAMDDNKVPLDEFFSRPINIHSHDWVAGGGSTFTIDPWSLFFNDRRVINRIANYNLLRCDLHIKVTINATPFHYGRAMLTYLPLAGFDTLSTTTFAEAADIVEASQRPHIFINPTCCEGGEMKLPFFYYKNYLSVPYDEWFKMGRLSFVEINSLEMVSAAPTPVTINVFAWAENVEYSLLTTLQPTAIGPQSGPGGPMKDETDEANMTGVISKPATILSKTLSKLTAFPSIAPLATASSMAAGAAAELAKYYGYSRPVITEAPGSMRPTMTASMCYTDTPDLPTKFTLDSKQELSIDPRISGMPEGDPMSIQNIASRESYMFTETWSHNDAAESLLFNFRVSPQLHQTDSNGGLAFAPVGAACLPFQYWTGKLKYRFQFVCSAFHRGRVRIVYDPNFSQEDHYNTVSSEIIDITQNSDFTLEVGISQEMSLIDMETDPSLTSVSNMVSNLPITTAARGNGVIAVYVLNDLMTPDIVNAGSIDINVYMSAGDDFELFVPTSNLGTYVFKQQSGMVSSMPKNSDCNEKEQNLTSVLCIGTTNNDELNKIYAGESIVSFRSLLKRYTLHEPLTFVESSGRRTWNARRCAFPYLRGNVAGAVHQTGALAPYNYCNTLVLHLITAMFSGNRGGIRYKLVPRGNLSEYSGYAERIPWQIAKYYFNQSSTVSYTSMSHAAYESTYATTGNDFSPPLGYTGMIATTEHINPTLEFECPYYSPWRFTPGKTEDWTQNGYGTYEGFRCMASANSTIGGGIDSFVAIGEDFQVYFFTGCPRMFYESAPLSLIHI